MDDFELDMTEDLNCEEEICNEVEDEAEENTETEDPVDFESKENEVKMPSFLLENSLSGEIWKQTIQSEKHFISNMGRVYSLFKKRFLKGSPDHGYLRVLINRKKILLHRLVAIHFIPNPENKPCVNHLGGKTDNRASMLEWVTVLENNIHAAKHVTKNRKIPIKQIDPETKTIVKVYEHLKDISSSEFNLGSLFNLLDTSKKYRKFIWERVNPLEKNPKNLLGELWVNLSDSIYPEINQYPKYQVSNLGRVKGSFGRIMKQGETGKYLTINLTNTQKRHSIRIHRLVIMAFNIPKRPDQSQIDHIDGNCLNNKLENLRWVSIQEHSQNEVSKEKRLKSAKRVKVKVIFIKNKKDIFSPENEFKIFESIIAVKKALGVGGTTINRYAEAKKIDWSRNYYYELYK